MNTNTYTNNDGTVVYVARAVGYNSFGITPLPCLVAALLIFGIIRFLRWNKRI